jgi:cobalt-zinc-cadmium efflux system membrane fusion protein
MDPATRTVKVRGVVDNPENLLKAEMYVMVDLFQATPAGTSLGVEVPAQAIFMKDNQAQLFVEVSPGQYQRQPVTVGTEKDGKVPVLGGLAAGQRVVTEGCLLLRSLLEPTS